LIVTGGSYPNIIHFIFKRIVLRKTQLNLTLLHVLQAKKYLRELVVWIRSHLGVKIRRTRFLAMERNITGTKKVYFGCFHIGKKN
jgi:hypothetical protein